MNINTLEEKKKKLYERLSGYKSIGVAFSGGVDSTLLLAVANRVLNGNVVAVTAVSPLQPANEVQGALRVARSLGVAHYRVDSGEMAHADFISNNRNRCYLCKKIIFADIRATLDKLGIETIAHAANTDDLKDFRPGMKAAEELDIIAPLIDAGMTKADIRDLSRQMGLSTWNKPAAACLASRIPYGTPITTRALEMIEASETVLMALGFRGFRVRHFDDTAKIELRPADFPRLLNPARRLIVLSEFRRIGYLNITMDLKGYSQGSLNRSREVSGTSPSVSGWFGTNPLS
jgi:pyridinium-3,5-biscarboxylic acid mononucleotide sulfurtransferase